MKIAFVNTSRGWGGAEEQMLAMTCELKGRGHSVTVVCRRNGPIEQRFRDCGLHVLPVVRKGIRSFIDPFRLALQARMHKFDIVHSHRDHDLPLSKLLALVTGSPLLLTQHCMPSRPSVLNYRLADRIFAVSAYIADGIRSRVPGVAERVGVITNGIDPAMFADPDSGFWRRNPLVEGRGPLLGVVGAYYKGQDELIGLLPGLLKEFPKLALILIGEDEARRQPLQDLAERLGVADAVIFAGRITREQMKDALAGLDLNVSAFRNEGFGLSVIEGFAVGTPFVGYAAGGYKEVVKDSQEAGFLVEKKEDLLSAVLSKLAAPPSLRADACKKHAEFFSLNKMVDDYENLYGSMVSEGSCSQFQ